MEQSQRHDGHLGHEMNPEARRIQKAVYKYLNHLEPFSDKEHKFGIESFKRWKEDIVDQILQDEPVLVALVGPSGSAKSTISEYLKLALMTDPKLTKHLSEGNRPFTSLSIVWSDLIKDFRDITQRHDIQFGRLPSDFREGVSRYAVHLVDAYSEALREAEAPGVIIVQFPGYPGNRGDEIARYIAKNNGYVCAPIGERSLYESTARIRRVAATSGLGDTMQYLTDNLIPVVGDPEDAYRELREDCAPADAVEQMQVDLLALTLSLIEQQLLNPPFGIPPHPIYHKDFEAAFVKDSWYLTKVIGKYVVPYILKEKWGFQPTNAFVCHNTTTVDVPFITNARKDR